MSVRWREKKVFITGHNGFIGRHLVGALKILGAKVQVSEVDLLKDKLSEKDCAKPDYVFHLAAVAPAVSDKVDSLKIVEDNINITKNVLEFVKKTKARMILVSSSHVYPSITSPKSWKEEEVEYGLAISSYGISKQMVEKYCIDYSNKHHFDIVVVRLANIYGPGDKTNRFIPTFIRKCVRKKNPLEVLGKGDTVRDFLYIDDAIIGLIDSVSLLKYANIINIGSGKGVPIRQIAECIKEHTGLAKEKIQYRTLKGGSVAYNVLDITKAKELLNFTPSVSLEEGLIKTIEWWNKQEGC
jgi:nucleoside-diphosphate-sugar epimerase